MHKFSLLAVLFCFFCGGAQAQEAPYVGMRHLKPKPAQPAPEPQQQQNKEAEVETETSPNLPTYKTISAKDALVKPDDLENWDHLNEAATAYSDIDVQKLVHVIESDRGAVPPQGLFLAAKALSDHGLMQQAAIYYFVGQLRLSFDQQRWPTSENAEDVKKLGEDQKKSPDQKSPSGSRQPRIDNPHQGIQDLANMIGQPIISWTMKDGKRMSEVMRETRQWDSTAPYAYLPEYDLTEPIPFEKWEKILTKNRETFFGQMESLTKALSRVRQ